jgi:predicted enzyme related to lactoylglutathione lyase
MTAPNLFITYVRDAVAAAPFYADLFGLKASVETARFVAFPIAPGVELALWSGTSDAVTPTTPRTSEVCVNVSGGAAEIDSLYSEWASKGVTVVQEPIDAPFGRTFVIADPDGNLIRVAPVD